jgi:hypothetical protein
VESAPNLHVRLGIMSAASPVPRSLVWATALDVLPPNRVIERRSDFLVIRSPSNPTHYWGNFLLFDREPVAGDARRWEALFDAEFADDPRVQHRTFGWDQTDGGPGRRVRSLPIVATSLARTSVSSRTRPKSCRTHGRTAR